MPQISKTKKKKIQEQILIFLFEISPDSAFTNKIAEQIARDEEFVKDLLLELKSNNLITEINKNSSGASYIKRKRWRITERAYKAYSTYQTNS